jgi:hypothetical protein
LENQRGEQRRHEDLLGIGPAAQEHVLRAGGIRYGNEVRCVLRRGGGERCDLRHALLDCERGPASGSPSKGEGPREQDVALYLGVEGRGSGRGGGGELVGELGADGGKDVVGAAAEGGGGSQPPQKHRCRAAGGLVRCGCRHLLLEDAPAQRIKAIRSAHGVFRLK